MAGKSLHKGVLDNLLEHEAPDLPCRHAARWPSNGHWLASHSSYRGIGLNSLAICSCIEPIRFEDRSRAEGGVSFVRNRPKGESIHRNGWRSNLESIALSVLKIEIMALGSHRSLWRRTTSSEIFNFSFFDLCNIAHFMRIASQEEASGAGLKAIQGDLEKWHQGHVQIFGVFLFFSDADSCMLALGSSTHRFGEPLPRSVIIGDARAWMPFWT